MKRNWGIATLLILVSIPAWAQVPSLLNVQGRVVVDGTNFNGTGEFKLALIGEVATEQAKGKAVVDDDGNTVTGVNVNQPGFGYSFPPNVTIVGGGGAGATAVAVVSGLRVQQINVTSPGSGYTSLPAVVIDPPDLANPVTPTLWSNDGTGTHGDEPISAVDLPVVNGLYSVLLGDTALAHMIPVSSTVFTNPAISLRVWFDDGVNGMQQFVPDQRVAAVGYAMLAELVPQGSITASSIAAGAVESMHIAPGAIGASQLSKPPQSGSIPSAVVDTAFGLGTFSETFFPAFNTAPNVSMSLESLDPIVTEAGRLVLTGRNPSGFSGTVLYPPPAPEYFTGLANDSAFSPAFHLETVVGNPSLTYLGDAARRLWFIRASDAAGTTWPPRIQVSSLDLGDTGLFSMDVVNGTPAVAVVPFAGATAYYVRSLNAQGSSWASETFVDTGGGSLFSVSLAHVSGRPAIACYADSFPDDEIRYQRADDSTGATWPTPTVVVSNAVVFGDVHMLVVNGRPAIQWGNNFVRANDTTGSSWGVPVVIDTNVPTYETSFAVVNGKPAAAFAGISSGDDIYYCQAVDANGTAWNTPVAIDVSPDTSQLPYLAVVQGKPTITHQQTILHFDGITFTFELRYSRALDADGAAWGAPAAVFSPDRMLHLGVADIGGEPTVFFQRWLTTEIFMSRNEDLPFTINWIALEP